MSVAAGDLRVQSESLYALILVPKTKQRLTHIRLCNFGVIRYNSVLAADR